MSVDLLTRIDELEKEVDVLKRDLSVYKYDKLTGLKGRHDLHALLQTLEGEPYDVYLYDVNRLKQINDDMGDEYLSTISENIVNTIPNSHCYRYGGDEFVVIKPVTSNDGEVMYDVEHTCGSVYRKVVGDDSNLKEIIYLLQHHMNKCKNNNGVQH